MKKCKTYLALSLWIITYQLIGFFMGQITKANIGTWYTSLPKSPLNPPNITFGIVWCILYIVLAYLGFILFHHRTNTQKIKRAYLMQMLLNWAWTPIFFGLHYIGTALIVLVLMVIINAYLTYSFWLQTKLHAVLSALYQLWIGFACYLNLYIWLKT